MKKIILSLLFPLVMIVAVPAHGAFFQNVSTRLTGAEEVPPVSTTTSGDFTINGSGSDSMPYTLRIHNAQNATMAHLHCGLPGQTGPVVVPIFEGSNYNGTVTMSRSDVTIASTASGCSPAINNKGDLMQAIKDGKIYANVHTTQHPGGEIRGQLRASSGGINFPNTSNIFNQMKVRFPFLNF